MTLNPPLRYLTGLSASIVLVTGAIWLYVLLFPQDFMESGYAIWKAKQGFISQCDLGELLISGDSRPEAAIDPRAIGIPSRTIAFGGETPTEEDIFIRRAMHCNRLPRTIVISFARPEFSKVSQYLWENGARFGYIGYNDLDDVSSTAQKLGDSSVENVPNRLGVSGKLRNILYAVHFPPLYFNALVTAQIWRRYDVNQGWLSNTRASLGHVAYVRHGANLQGAVDQVDPQNIFRVSPVQDYFFAKTISLLKGKNIPVLFVPMPVPQSEAGQMTIASQRQFETYLFGYAKRFPNFRIATPLVVSWPDWAFVDGIHLESKYATKFTDLF